MNIPLIVATFIGAALLFLLVVYVLMPSPEREDLDRERLEFYRRENRVARERGEPCA